MNDKFAAPKSVVSLIVDEIDTGDPNSRQARLEGSLDSDGAPILDAVLERWSRQSIQLARLDCSGLDFISSCGIGTIVASVGEFQDEGAKLVLAHIRDDLIEVFSALDLLDYINIESKS